MHELTIMPELQKLLPKHSKWQVATLKESIRVNGCLSPIVVWNRYACHGNPALEAAWAAGKTSYCKYCYKKQGLTRTLDTITCDECGAGLGSVTFRDVIVDGHVRYAICRELSVECETADIELDDISEAIEFRIKTHLSGRILNEAQRVAMALKMKHTLKTKG